MTDVSLIDAIAAGLPSGIATSLGLRTPEVCAAPGEGKPASRLHGSDSGRRLPEPEPRGIGSGTKPGKAFTSAFAREHQREKEARPEHRW
jgi:hypothetical protein